jgi:NitT/TauT family transport system permease protein
MSGRFLDHLPTFPFRGAWAQPAATPHQGRPTRLPEILAGIRLGLIRGVKGVVIGQLLVAIVGYGALFETFSRNFRMAQFWALAILLFAFAMVVAELIERAERRVEYYAGVR